jgi:hypothetical protein
MIITCEYIIYEQYLSQTIEMTLQKITKIQKNVKWSSIDEYYDINT